MKNKNKVLFLWIIEHNFQQGTWNNKRWHVFDDVRFYQTGTYSIQMNTKRGTRNTKRGTQNTEHVTMNYEMSSTLSQLLFRLFYTTNAPQTSDFKLQTFNSFYFVLSLQINSFAKLKNKKTNTPINLNIWYFCCVSIFFLPWKV